MVTLRVCPIEMAEGPVCYFPRRRHGRLSHRVLRVPGGSGNGKSTGVEGAGVEGVSKAPGVEGVVLSHDGCHCGVAFSKQE